MKASVAHRWRPIEGLPEDWPGMADPRLPVLAREWQEGRKRNPANAELVALQQQQLREIAIETGIIERLYTIDRGTTETLIRIGLVEEELARGTISAPAAVILAMLEDHKSATEGVFDFVASKRALSTSYIKELHAHLTRHQTHVDGIDAQGRPTRTEFRRGEWKLLPNNPRRPDGGIHEYCPPEHVAAEMDRLTALHAGHEAAGVAPDVLAAWLHHRFTQIHPFQDGNGRVARTLATLVFLKAGWFPLSITRNDNGYIPALEEADRGEMKPLVGLFGRAQQRWFDRAITILSRAEAVALGSNAVDEVARRIKARTGLREVPDPWRDIRKVVVDVVGTELLRVARRLALDDSIGRTERNHFLGDLFRQERYLLIDGSTGGRLGFCITEDICSKSVFFLPFVRIEERQGPFNAHEWTYEDVELKLSMDMEEQQTVNTVRRWLADTIPFLLLEWERRR